MLRFQACRFELRPKGEQERNLRQFASGARYVRNRALAIENEERGKAGRKRSGYGALRRDLTRWRNHPLTEWLRQSPTGRKTTARIACRVHGAAMPSAAGTRRAEELSCASR